MRNKKLILLISIIFILLSAVVIFLTMIPPGAKNVPHALTNTLAADGRFEFFCNVETDGENREYFALSGEKIGESRHIQGSVLESNLDLYYLNGYIYRYDEADQTWQCYSASDLGEAVNLYAELEPASAFAYDSLIDITYLDHQIKNGKICYNYSVTPVPTDWVGEFFTDVKYSVCLNRLGKLVSAEVYGTLKDEKDTTMHAMVIFEKNNKIIIETPTGE